MDPDCPEKSERKQEYMATKIGVIGAGGMAQYHIQGFRQAGAEIVALADVNVEAAKKAAKELQIPKAFGDVAPLLESDDIDAVSIIVPNKFHAPLAIQSLDAGKHVFCEKPPAICAAEVEQMIAAANAANKIMMFNFNNRARPDSMAIKKAIDDGQIGRINSAQARWVRRTGIPGFGGWFTNKELSGGGPLIDLLHMLDLALHFMDYPQPAYVLARTFDDFINDRTFKGPWGIPDNEAGVTDVESSAHGCITFTTGQIVTFQISWAEMVRGEEVAVSLQGTKAGVVIERRFESDGIDDTSVDTCEMFVQQDGKPVNRTLELPSCEDMGRSRSAENFIRAIADTEAPLNTPAQALALMKIIDAAYQSAQDGGPVCCL